MHSRRQQIFCCLFVERHDVRFLAFVDAGFRDDDFARLRRFRDVVHDIEHDILDDALEAARTRLALDGFLGHGAQGVFIEFQLDVIHGEQLLILLDGSIFWLRQDAQQSVFIQGLQRADDRQAADDFRDDAVVHESSGRT